MALLFVQNIVLISILICLMFSLRIAQQIDNKEDQSIDKNDNMELSSDSKPSIEGDQIIEARRGKSVTMNCMVNNVKNYKIAWYFNGIILALGNLRIRDDKRISVENLQPNEWKLTIDSITEADEGYYSCRLSNGMKKLMFLRVGVPPRFTSGNNGSHQVVINAVEHQNITLSCEAEGNPIPTIYWYKNNELITTGPHLSLINISRFSHSEYECVARNKIEPDPSRHFKMNVNFKPSINLMYHLKEHKKKLHYSYNSNSNTDFYKPNEAGNQINDGELQLVCEIFGNPIHAINWYKDGFKVRDDSPSTKHAHEYDHKKKRKQITIHTTPNNQHKFISKLKIKNVNFMDNGVYECLVNGLEGNVSKSVTVNVINTKVDNDLTENDQLLDSIISKINTKTEKVSLQKEGFTEDAQSNQLSIESNYLLHGRGARSNNTKVEENTYDYTIENKNSASTFNNCFYFKFLVIYVVYLQLIQICK